MNLIQLRTAADLVANQADISRISTSDVSGDVTILRMDWDGKHYRRKFIIHSDGTVTEIGPRSVVDVVAELRRRG